MDDAGPASPLRRVAVIAVHGVADQLPGETARAVTELLVASGTPDTVSYAAVDSDTVTLAVDPLPPRLAPHVPTPATARRQHGPLFKAWLQSRASDFQREGWQAPEKRQEAQQAQGRRRQSPVPGDPGIAVTDYLLFKHQRSGARRTVYQTTRLGLERRADGEHTDVHVYEMYWADLSRLSGAVPRIVSELFTLVFRLSTLGRDTVHAACVRFGNDRRWRLHAGLHTLMDWVFVYGLSLLMLQLLLLGLFLVGLRLVPEGPALAAAHVAVSATLVATGALLAFYRWGDKRWPKWVPAVLLGGAGIAGLAVPTPLHFGLIPLLLLGAITLLNELGLKVAEERAPLARRIGRGLWLATAFVTLATAAGLVPGLPSAFAPHSAAQLRTGWVPAALFATELVLWAVKVLWIGIGAVLALWFLNGVLLQRRGGFEARASIATGRLGTVMSMGIFLILAMGGWAALRWVLRYTAEGVEYTPRLFDALPAAQAALSGAQRYLEDRFVQSTATFVLVTVVLVLLLAYLLIMLTPAILAEAKLMRRHPQDKKHIDHLRARLLGRWLTGGYHRLDTVAVWIFALGVLLAVAVALGYARVLDLQAYEPGVKRLSQGVLGLLVVSAAGFTATLVALGGLLSRYAPMLRAPLDIALDVDNHLREFPRAAIPRARIFSRYAALLKHVASQGYDRIVIVAHSQGTVISAELLRYLSSEDGCQPPQPAPAGHGASAVNGRLMEFLTGQLHGELRPRPAEGQNPPQPHPLRDLSLLTLGCPLRQLYAARFPSLYRWVLSGHTGAGGAVYGPRAADIGVARWFNAYCSGDYVGRWLWSYGDVRQGEDALVHPMATTLQSPDGFGRMDVYAPFHPMPPSAAKLHGVTELEMCLGLGAHTHYFEQEQSEVAWLIDSLVRGPRHVGAQAVADGTPTTAPQICPV